MAGPAIRCHEMARSLSRTLDVVLASPFPNPVAVDGVRRELLSEATIGALLSDTDVVVVQGLLMERFPRLFATPRPIVVDLYDPLLIEALDLFRQQSARQRRYSHSRIVSQTLLQLHRGDYFLVGNRRQQDFYLGMLAGANRLNPRWAEGGTDARRIIGVVPFGIPSQPPEAGPRVLKGVDPRFPEEGPLILWSGGMWDWLDPFTLIEAMPHVVERLPGARLLFWGTRHPNPEVPAMQAPVRARELAQRLKLLDSVVFFEEWIPYAMRGARIAEADLGVCLSGDRLEERFAQRSRIMDYIWAGVPVIASKGDPVAKLVQKKGLGRLVPPGRSDLLAEAIVELHHDRPQREAMRARMRELADRFTWDRAVRPLERFIAHAGEPRRPNMAELLEPMASVLSVDRPLLSPFVKAAMSLARDGVLETLTKASRSGARLLGIRPAGGARCRR
jgi:glycosyltransferase involved in cell wall biosynthesis